MLNKERHQLIMGKVLRDIYSDTSISSLLGFKGGTCAYLFYDLPRFSVDLDFDLLNCDEVQQKILYERVGTILGAYGELKDRCIKRNTIFFLLSYGDADHNIKVEVNTRLLVPDIRDYYKMREYLGISMLVGTKEYLFASKLVALTERTDVAMRDVFDVWFFANSTWGIDAEVIQARTGKGVCEYLDDCIKIVEGIADNHVLRGLAELLSDEKAKVWVKTQLRKETVFLLKNYQSVLR
jgi:predicted nucleotidyltransferase component of viral defense system